MNKTKSIIAAGTLTGLVLIALLILGMSGLNPLSAQANKSSNLSVSPNSNLPPAVEQTTADPSSQSWQNYSAELEQAVEMMQDREAQYQAQIQSANETIMQLQDQINSANTVQMSSQQARYDDDYEDEEHEHEAYEHEEHEHDEHEYEEHEDDD